MPRFEPKPGEKYSVNGDTYEVMEHPSAPFMPYSQEGRKAVVYQVADKDKKLFAWKVFKESYRLSSLVGSCEILKTLAQPGLEVSNRTCIENKIEPELIKKYPELEYSILMPWVEGRTWFDLIYQRVPISKQNSLVAARNVARVLAELEKAGFAHCDIAGTNVIVNPKTGKIGFVDIEDTFGPDLSRPHNSPQGTEGYRHVEIYGQHDQWRKEGDRFAASIILGEILCWHDENFRALADNEHYFGQQEISSTNSPRYKALIKILEQISPDLLELFRKAWNSKALSECPEVESWRGVLDSLAVGMWKPINLPPVTLPFGESATNRLSTFNHHSESGIVLARPQIYPMASVRVNQKNTISWMKINGAYEYELQLAEGDSAVQEASFETIYQGPQAFFETSFMTYGVYYFRVRSQAETRTSSWSPVEGMFVYPLAKPATPKLSPIYNLLGDRSFHVRWNSVTDVQWYEVEEIQGSWPFKKSRNVVVDGSSHIKDTQVLVIGRNAGIYFYRVRAYNYCGYSDFSEMVSAEVQPSLLPNMTQVLKIENPNGESNYSISWTAIPGAAGYVLFESQSPEIDVASKIYQGSNNKFTVINKAPGRYYYSVSAHNSQGLYDKQSFSGWASTKVVLQAPLWHLSKQTYNVQVDNTDDASIQLIWQPVKQAVKYNLSWTDEMGNHHIEELATNSCMIARPEGKYEFQVCAISENNVVGSWSLPVWVTITQQQDNNYQVMIDIK